MVFHCSLSYRKSPQASRTLLSILADIKKAVVWVISTRPLISQSSCPFTNPLVTLPRAPITIDIIITFMFLTFFKFPNKVQVFIFLFSDSFNFPRRSTGTAMSTILQILLFLLIVSRSGCLVEIRWFVCISKSQRSMSFILQDSFWVVHITFVRMVKFKFLAQFLLDHVAHPVFFSLILLLCYFATLLLFTH